MIKPLGKHLEELEELQKKNRRLEIKNIVEDLIYELEIEYCPICNQDVSSCNLDGYEEKIEKAVDRLEGI